MLMSVKYWMVDVIKYAPTLRDPGTVVVTMDSSS